MTPDRDPKTDSEVLVPGITISSPRGSDLTGNANGDCFPRENGVAVGTYNTGGGAFTKVVCQFFEYNTANPAGTPYETTVPLRAGVWSVAISKALDDAHADGPYDLKATLHVNGASAASATNPQVLVEASPRVSIASPASGTDTLNAGMDFQVVADLAAGNNYSKFQPQIVYTGASQAGVEDHPPFGYPALGLTAGKTAQVSFPVNGQMGDHRRVHVTVGEGDFGTDNPATASAAELKLN